MILFLCPFLLSFSNGANMAIAAREGVDFQLRLRLQRHKRLWPRMGSRLRLRPQPQSHPRPKLLAPLQAKPQLEITTLACGNPHVGF